MNNKKIIILIVLLTIIVFSYFLFINKLMFKTKEKPLTENIINEKESEEIVDKTKEEEEKKKVISESDIKSIETIAREKLSNFKFDEATIYSSTELGKYNINNSKEYEEYKQTFNEMALMANFPEMKEREEIKQVRELIKGLKDSENFLVSIMWLESSDRLYFLETSESINPILDEDTGINIIQKRKISPSESPHLKGVTVSIKDIKEITEYKVDIEGNILLAYIVENNNRLHFYKLVEETEGSTPYYTIREWENIWKELDNNLNGSKKEEKEILENESKEESNEE